MAYTLRYIYRTLHLHEFHDWNLTGGYLHPIKAIEEAYIIAGMNMRCVFFMNSALGSPTKPSSGWHASSKSVLRR